MQHLLYKSLIDTAIDGLGIFLGLFDVCLKMRNVKYYRFLLLKTLKKKDSPKTAYIKNTRCLTTYLFFGKGKKMSINRVNKTVGIIITFKNDPTKEVTWS